MKKIGDWYNKIIKANQTIKVLISISILIIIVFSTFIVYFLSNIIPKKISYNFENTEIFELKDYNIENKSGRIAIFFNTNSSLFKEYKYHSYISGDGVGNKIFLELFLISKDKEICYKIKSICYEYEDKENLKFMGYYYDMFIDKKKEYNLAIFIPDTNILYDTNITI